jgi:hypothetical protein
MLSTEHLAIEVVRQNSESLFMQKIDFSINRNPTSMKDSIVVIIRHNAFLSMISKASLWRRQSHDQARHTMLVESVVTILESPHGQQFLEELWDNIPVRGNQNFRDLSGGFNISWDRDRTPITIATPDNSGHAQTTVSLSGLTAFEVLGYYLIESLHNVDARMVLEGFIDIYESLIADS